jgi:hypothetical protein
VYWDLTIRAAHIDRGSYSGAWFRGTSAVRELLMSRPKMKPALIFAMAAVSAVFETTACSAEPASESTDPQSALNDVKALEDPTLLAPRVWLESEWTSLKDGSDKLEETLGGLWAWRVSADQDWGVRAKVPVTMYFAGDTIPESDKAALGDIKIATGTAYRLSNVLRAGGGLELRFPSGTDDTLSDNTWRLQEFGTVAWDAAPWLTLSPTLEHNHSVAEQTGAEPQHFLELFFPATFLLPEDWAVTVKYETKFDFKNDNARTQSAKVQVAKRLDELPLAFSLSLKKPLDPDSDSDFQINFVSTYFLPSK